MSIFCGSLRLHEFNGALSVSIYIGTKTEPTSRDRTMRHSPDSNGGPLHTIEVF